jgi:hypothetical protein
MGADVFEQYEPIPIVDAAFRAAVAKAQYDHGHSGYTGTLAEKENYVIIQDTPLTLHEAGILAEKLIDDCDDRIDDKWGPAGAIPVCSKDGKTIGWLFFGWASS